MSYSKTAQTNKQRIVSALLDKMERMDMTVGELANKTNVPKTRLNMLLSPININLDLLVLAKVCKTLRLKFTVKSAGKA